MQTLSLAARGSLIEGQFHTEALYREAYQRPYRTSHGLIFS